MLWDLDGTLVDSAEEHWEAWRETFEDRGLSVTREQFHETFGQRNDRILAQWFGDVLDPARGRRIAEAKERAYRRFVRERGVAVYKVPDTVEVVEEAIVAFARQVFTPEVVDAEVIEDAEVVEEGRLELVDEYGDRRVQGVDQERAVLHP